MNIANLNKRLLEQVNMTTSDIVDIGMGVLGMIDSAKDELLYSNNLDWEHLFILDEVKNKRICL